MYPAPGGGLPIDPNAVKKALSGIADALPKTGDAKSAQALAELGVPDELITAFGQIGELAGTLAKVVPFVSVAFELGKILGIFKSGDDALLDAIDKLWRKTHALFQAKDEKWTTNEVFQARHRILSGLDDVSEFQEDLKQGLDPAQLTLKLNLMKSVHRQVRDGLYDLLSPSLWQSSLDGDDFKSVWALNLFFDPGPGEPGPNHRAIRPQGDGNPVERFDHRVMAPVVCAMTQCYLVFIKQLVPEFRSSGDFDTSIARIAPLIENLANQMRNQTVARTHWYPQDFAYLYPVHSQNPPGGVFVPSYAGYHVGALDLRSSTVPTPLNVPYAFDWIVDSSGTQVHWGAMHFNWPPPAQIQLEDHGNQGTRFRVLNPEECALAANTLAEESYASVLYASGYFNLVHLSGLLRHLYTAPLQSETVAGAITPHRSPLLPRKTVNVVGAEVFPFAPATSTAEQESQTTFIRANLTTQPRDRDRRLDYKVWLRTVPAEPDGTSDYGSVYGAHYEDEPQPQEHGPGFKRLVCEFAVNRVLDGEKLVDGKTPDQLVQVGPKTVTLTADTFDWWIPVPEAVQSLPQMTEHARKLREHGWLRPRQTTGSEGVAAPSTRAPGKWADLSLVQGAVFEPPSGSRAALLTQAPSLAPVGERRMVVRKEVQVTCSLTWNGIDLIVRVEGRPEDRNFDLFLVVEEHLFAHEQWLHTSFMVPVTSQLTFVPEKFFREEQALIDKANEFWTDFNERYTESHGISPLDPIVQVNTWRDRYSVQGLQRIASVVRSERPDVLAEFMRARGLELPAGQRIAVHDAATAS
jgi:hypothetical protein